MRHCSIRLSLDTKISIVASILAKLAHRARLFFIVLAETKRRNPDAITTEAGAVASGFRRGRVWIPTRSRVDSGVVAPKSGCDRAGIQTDRTRPELPASGCESAGIRSPAQHGRDRVGSWLESSLIVAVSRLESRCGRNPCRDPRRVHPRAIMWVGPGGRRPPAFLVTYRHEICGSDAYIDADESVDESPKKAAYVKISGTDPLSVKERYDGN
ncbi:hypothetical protein ZIOFF_065611 [Zingiber officinale]|uniref:Uncharacterized protein n=1 Tax=Zingiber officinale TaxID=94328 RepID=A0A8J5KBJ9_ZINOF|nr:hypothetical protein ZIOFF_065611 [Zingiber officinale]